MKYPIYHTQTEKVLFEADIDKIYKNYVSSAKRYAVLWAIENKINLAYADLTHANLSNINLSKLDFTGAKFKGSDLSDAIISGAFFCNADMRGAILDGVNTTGPEFDGAIF
jgi:uncharacterized protein YjbI with pentapeptide repeats